MASGTIRNLIVKSYDFSTTTNSSVSPFGAYQELNITSDVSSFGEPVSMFVESSASGASAIPTIIKYCSGISGNYMYVYSKNATTGHVIVVYKG